MNRAQLRELAETVTITLDGKPAQIVGWENAYLTVRQIGGYRYGFEWSDLAIEYVLADGGRFESI